MTGLTPYDRGTVLEPKPWVKATDDGHFTGEDFVRSTVDEDFGKVDFDDDEDATICTVRVQPDGADHVVIIDSMLTSGDLRVVVNGGDFKPGDVEPERGTLEHHVWNGQRAIDLIADEDDDITMLADTLAELMHWAEGKGIYFNGAVGKAWQYVQDERREK